MKVDFTILAVLPPVLQMQYSKTMHLSNLILCTSRRFDGVCGGDEGGFTILGVPTTCSEKSVF
jgi:hypothetical protein